MKAQVSSEFLIFMGIISIGLLMVLHYIYIDMGSIAWKREKAAAEDLGVYLQNEINTATGASDGYSRVFSLPQSKEGIDYSISSSDNMSLIIETGGGRQFHYIVPPYVGNLTKGQNKIDKLGGIVYVNVI